MQDNFEIVASADGRRVDFYVPEDFSAKEHTVYEMNIPEGTEEFVLCHNANSILSYPVVNNRPFQMFGESICGDELISSSGKQEIKLNLEWDILEKEVPTGRDGTIRFVLLDSKEECASAKAELLESELVRMRKEKVELVNRINDLSLKLEETIQGYAISQKQMEELKKSRYGIRGLFQK